MAEREGLAACGWCCALALRAPLLRFAPSNFVLIPPLAVAPRLPFRFAELPPLALQVAEREGFEPPEPCGSVVFKTTAIDHSATSPMVLLKRSAKRRACRAFSHRARSRRGF
jgi:hypothetical protein